MTLSPCWRVVILCALYAAALLHACAMHLFAPRPRAAWLAPPNAQSIARALSTFTLLTTSDANPMGAIACSNIEGEKKIHFGQSEN
jgi:hypothetical protein